ncbi:hypothetical protein ACLMJK_009394 [Lecanora helva]
MLAPQDFSSVHHFVASLPGNNFGTIAMVRPVTEDDIGLRTIYTPQRSSDADAEPLADIVAIHGIGAHPDDGWCKKVEVGGPGEHYVNWLKDPHMLPAVVPGARIMRYRYQSQWFGEEAISQKASTVAQRLLLSLRQERKARFKLNLRVHCWAIVDAERNSTEWPGIFKSTTGIVFFGTPFRGAAGLNQSELLQAAQSQYEEGQKFVVDESLGYLDQNESTKKYSLSREHFSMNKLGRPEEEDFQTVYEVIEKIKEQSPGLIAAREQGR